MSSLPKSIHRCRRYPTKFNSGRDIPKLTTIDNSGLDSFEQIFERKITKGKSTIENHCPGAKLNELTYGMIVRVPPMIWVRGPLLTS